MSRSADGMPCFGSTSLTGPGLAPHRSVRDSAWTRMLAGALATALAIALVGCGDAGAVPTCTPTPSAIARLLFGTWEVAGGQLAKSPIVLGEQVDFRPDGTFTWAGKAGQYSIFRDQLITLKRSAVGEAFEYTFVVSEDALTMSRATNCGKEDRYELQRVK